MDKVVTHSLSEAELASEIYHIVGTLIKQGRISGNPENVRIERVKREAILPCRRSKELNSLNLKQLEWAANNGHFWFLGPIKSLKVILGKGEVQETLVSELDRISFITVLNELNYEDFIKVKSDLIKTANDIGFRVEFSQPHGSYNVRVTISANRPMLKQNVTDFLRRIEKVLKTI